MNAPAPMLSDDERATLSESIERVAESLRLTGEAFHVETGGGGHYYGTDLRNLVNVARWWLEMTAARAPESPKDRVEI